MPLKIHVFIATSKGLVALQNITDLQDRALQSVITINGSTDLASISPNYHRFVQKSTGLVQTEFGGDSFRANISRNIDHGSSWQLPFYIAHFIESNNGSVCQLGQGIVQTSDVVLIATGQINTTNGHIESVKQVPEKCITASAQIKMWMKTGVLVEFFVPASDFHALLPELDCAIYPVIDMQQIKQHVAQLLPITQKNERDVNPSFKNSLNESRAFDATNNYLDATSQDKDIKTERTEDTTLLSHMSRISKGIINAKPRRAFTSNILAVAILLILVVVLIQWGSIPNGSNADMRFITSTKSSPYCDANAVELLTPIAERYVSRMPPVSFKQICSMRLISSSNIPQIWLVADSLSLIELEHKKVNSELHWIIPIPSQQMIDREYILIVTDEYLDLSDFAAFKTYLSRLDRTQKPSLELLAQFFSQIDINPQYVSQKLVASSQ